MIKSAILISFLFTTACSATMPASDKIIIEVRSDEAYYAGFFRACEMIISQQEEGAYSQVDTTRLEPDDQCVQMVQHMMDLDAASVYSRGWPGMQPLSLESQGQSIHG